jgi:hypothetical protein
MDTKFKVPVFYKYKDVLNLCGVRTNSARSFWGGVTDKGEIVVTTWLDAKNDEGHFYIWRPKTNHGGLKDQWDARNMCQGAEVIVILLRQRGNVPIGKGNRSIKDAALMPEKWRVKKIFDDQDWSAIIEPC